MWGHNLLPGSLAPHVHLTAIAHFKMYSVTANVFIYIDTFTVSLYTIEYVVGCNTDLKGGGAVEGTTEGKEDPNGWVCGQSGWHERN